MKLLPSQPAQRGIALVIVLAFLVLIAGLMIAFFSNVSTEFSSARSFADGVTTKQLADSAVNVVMGQIREATALEGGAWASQPGMIRVYGAAGATPGAALTPSDRLHSLYKLYSSEQLILSGTDLTTTNATENFANWWQQPAAFTDLNQPVKLTLQTPGAASRTSYRYPIMDPSFAKVVSGTGQVVQDGTDGVVVEGFTLTEDEDRTLPRQEEVARMPARWIYVLRDGTLTTGTASGSGRDSRISWQGTGTNIPTHKRPTAENPIVGRIAYWTDDETSKININTAGGFSLRDIPPGYNERSYAGSFWDTPCTSHKFDLGGLGGGTGGAISGWNQTTGRFEEGSGGLAICQPLNGEVQRYPGHPATTSMGLLFGSFLNSEQIYQLTPRILGGNGSTWGGTAEMPSSAWATAIPGALDKLLKKDRLYASVDELLFSSQAGANQARATNAGGLTPDLLEKTRFFLTAHSRAPELNLRGRPRLSLWPVRWDNPSEANSGSYRTAADKALAFCATLGTNDGARDWSRRFYFQRYNPHSTTHDANIPRNAQLYSYLQDLTGQGIPGFGARSFLDKFGDERDQILTEMFDHIRTINLRDGTELAARGLPTNPSVTTPVAKIIEREKIQFAPRGLVVPTKRTNATGIGRFPTISEASIVLYHAGYQLNDGTVTLDYKQKFAKDANGNYLGTAGTHISRVSADLVRAFLVFEMFVPSMGYATMFNQNKSSEKTGAIEIEVSGMESFQLNGQSLLFPAGARTVHWTTAGNGIGGGQGFQNQLYANRAHTSAESNYYHFQSDLSRGPGVPVPVPAPTVPATAALTGARLNVRVLFNGMETQSFQLDFPNATVPTPTDAVWLNPNAAGIFAVVGNNTAAPGPYPDPGGFYPKPLGYVGPAEWACGNGDQTGAVKSLAGRLLSTDGSFGVVIGAASTGWDSVDEKVTGQNTVNRPRQLFQPGDTIRSIVFQHHDATRADGDFRIAAITDSATAAAAFRPHPDYNNPEVRRAQLWTMSDGAGAPPFFPNNSFWGNYEPVIGSTRLTLGQAALAPTGPNQSPILCPRQSIPNSPSSIFTGQIVTGLPQNSDLLPGVLGVRRNDGQLGDFDTGHGRTGAGPFSGKTDDGILSVPALDDRTRLWGYSPVYYGWGDERGQNDSFFSPNRQVSSAVVFGSLPAGRRKHWETLCFCPNPAGVNHPGNVAPKDSLLLDLFHMPIVEPYAISEPISTAGKVNMNYGIAPFNWIKRSTAVRAALQSTRVTAIPITSQTIWNYKNNPPVGDNPRLLVDRDETLKASDALFAEFPGNLHGGFYKSATQICDRFLYPKTLMDGSTGNVPRWEAGEGPVRTFWYGNGGTGNTVAARGQALTGDNLRERPYRDLYPRLTTKSNTYTVHMRVQTLRKKPGSQHDVWDESSDQVTSEYRGSSTIERYIDPQDPRFDNQHPDYINVDTNSLEPAYRFRVVNSKRFLPY